MSLSALVAFAQRNFGSLSEHTRVNDAGGDVGTELEAPDPFPTRPGLPLWVRQRTEEQELPIDTEYPWRIEGPIDAHQAPPDVNALGADALAFYAPFHFYKYGWGIFIRMSGVKYLAGILKGATTLHPGDERCLDLAESILEALEWHHAATEIACTRAELTARKSLYQPYFASAPAARLEEALANAQAISWVFQHGDAVERSNAERWMSGQGPGYRDYRSRLSSRAFSEGLDQAARFMTGFLPDPTPRADSSLHTFLFRGARGHRSMPITRVNDLADIRISVLRPFPREDGVQVFVHSNDHPPPHIHIQVLSSGNETRYSWPT